MKNTTGHSTAGAPGLPAQPWAYRTVMRLLNRGLRWAAADGRGTTGGEELP